MLEQMTESEKNEARLFIAELLIQIVKIINLKQNL